MDTSLILILVLAFAFAATHLEKRFLHGRVRLFHGLEYLLIGILVGPQALSFLGAESIQHMAPLLSVITGLLGFIYGLPLQVEGSQARMPGGIRVGCSVTVLTAATVGGLSYVGMEALLPDAVAGTAERAIAALVLGFGAAACSAESILTTIGMTRSEGPISTLLPRTAATMRVLAIVGLGLATASAHGLSGHAFEGVGLSALEWVGLTVILGALVGLIFHVFLGDEREHEKVFVAIIGVVSLGSGVAYALQLSPLFLNLVAGATVANLSTREKSFDAVATRIRRPFDATLLLLAGAAWVPISAILWLLPLGFVVIRSLALRAGTWLATRRNPTLDPSIPRLGYALLSQGALAVAIAVNYQMVPGHALSEVVVTCLLLSAVVNEFWAASAVRQVLQNGGETARAPLPPQGDEEVPFLADLTSLPGRVPP